jgi:hypothetical protein
MTIAPVLRLTRRSVLLGIAAWLTAAGIVLAAVPRFSGPPPFFRGDIVTRTPSPRSLAGQCGFRAGDQILSVNGLPAEDAFTALFHARHCHALVVRDGHRLVLSANLVHVRPNEPR